MEVSVGSGFRSRPNLLERTSKPFHIRLIQSGVLGSPFLAQGLFSFWKISSASENDPQMVLRKMHQNGTQTINNTQLNNTRPTVSYPTLPNNFLWNQKTHFAKKLKNLKFNKHMTCEPRVSDPSPSGRCGQTDSSCRESTVIGPMGGGSSVFRGMDSNTGNIRRNLDKIKTMTFSKRKIFRDRMKNVVTKRGL